MVEMYIALSALAVIVLLCFLGIFHDAYEDNWLQCFGMVIVGFAAAMLSIKIHERTRVSPELLWFILGWLCYASGVALKVYRHRRRPKGTLKMQ